MKIAIYVIKNELTSTWQELIRNFMFEIHQIDYYGNDDGYATITINSVTSIAYHSSDEIMLERL